MKSKEDVYTCVYVYTCVSVYVLFFLQMFSLSATAFWLKPVYRHII